MNPQLRPLAALLAILLLLAGAFWAQQSSVARADTATPAETRTITVSGLDQQAVAPDIATITIGVTAQGETAEAAQETATQLIEQVTVALRQQGIAPSDIRTQWYNLNPRYGNGPTKPGKVEDQVTGFQVNHSLTVIVRKLDQVGVVMDAAVKAGANRIDGVNYQVADPTALQLKGYEGAVKDARAKAEAIAKALGLNILGVQKAEASNTWGGPIPLAKAAALAGNTVVPVQPGTQVINTSVQVTYIVGPANGQ